MCCFFTILAVLGPRAGILVWYLVQPMRWQLAFPNSWIWPLLGAIFLPWLTIMYVIVSPGGVVGFDWVWLGLSLFADIASYTGGTYGNRNRLGYGR